LQDTVVARGRYITVWQLTQKDGWKFLVDLGVSDTPADTGKNIIRIDAVKESGGAKAIKHIYPLVAAENNFITLPAKNKKKAYRNYLSNYSILNRNTQSPAINTSQQQDILHSTPPVTTCKMDG
jgi:hypothetical protein